jgi:hypothetical protein
MFRYPEFLLTSSLELFCNEVNNSFEKWAFCIAEYGSFEKMGFSALQNTALLKKWAFLHCRIRLF